MSRKVPEELSLKEIRFLLVNKRRAWHQSRLEYFKRTGRVIVPAGSLEATEVFGATPFIERKNSSERGRPRRTWLGHVLLGIEFLAVVGFIAIMINSFSALAFLNRSVSEAFQLPAVEPTPLIREVVLPDGHTPPNSMGETKPNEAEVPPHLRPVWQASISLPTPIPESKHAVRIQIPAIGVDAPVVQGDGWEQLKKGVAQHLGTPNPGEDGNIVLSGHNDVYGEVFRYLDRLSPGDSVILFSSQRKYTYIVTGTQMVEPTAVEVMAPTSDARVTLISCHPYLVDIHRIVITAILQNF